MFRRLPALLISALAAAPMLPAAAETLLLDGVEQASTSASQRPSRGMTMDKVASTWGQPATKNSAVGDPPISRWEYPNFIVYFEYSRVIHAVHKN
ncbi:MAG: hypothetical protein JSV45_12970 [Chromatiales bacterium]|nr:MAG: hypothetical protein JSV45_12970 [Chromatiales bacterium]